MTTAKPKPDAPPSKALAKPPLKTTLEAHLPAIAAALPTTMTPEVRQRFAERMVKVALGAWGRSETLRECTQASIVKSVVVAAELGLEAGGILGEAYLVPFNNKIKDGGRDIWVKEAQLITGYRGLIKLARQSGEVSSVTAQVVYTNDTYDVELGLDPRVLHKPNLTGDRGDMLFAYAGVVLKDGGHQLDVMTRSDIEKIRMRSQTGKKNTGPWAHDTAEMWRKTVLRRLMKYCPLSSDRLQRAMQRDDELEGDVLDTVSSTLAAVPDDLDPAEPRTPEARSRARSGGLADRISQKRGGPGGNVVDVDHGDLDLPDDVQGERERDDGDAPPNPSTRAARDGSDGSVPADQEPTDEELDKGERQPGED